MKGFSDLNTKGAGTPGGTMHARVYRPVDDAWRVPAAMAVLAPVAFHAYVVTIVQLRSGRFDPGLHPVEVVELVVVGLVGGFGVVAWRRGLATPAVFVGVPLVGLPWLASLGDLAGPLLAAAVVGLLVAVPVEARVRHRQRLADLFDVRVGRAALKVGAGHFLLGFGVHLVRLPWTMDFQTDALAAFAGAVFVHFLLGLGLVVTGIAPVAARRRYGFSTPLAVLGLWVLVGLLGALGGPVYPSGCLGLGWLVFVPFGGYLYSVVPLAVVLLGVGLVEAAPRLLASVDPRCA